jgi:uncharacterized protein
MRRDVLAIVFLLVVFVLGALLSPPLYWAAQNLANTSRGMREIAENPFGRYLTRTLMIVSVLGLWPLLHMARMPFRELGLSVPDWRGLARGAALALITLGAVVLIAMLLDAREWRRAASVSKIARAVLLGLTGAALTAVLEELIFRGVLFGLLRKGGRWLRALIISSAIFAVVHLLHKPESPPVVQWTSGFAALWQMLGLNSMELADFISLFNLFLCGGTLAWAFQRTGTLWFSIGLHAGWIFWLKFANALTTAPANSLFWGSRKVIDGCGATVALLLTLIAIPFLVPKRNPSHEPLPRETMARIE